LQKALRQATGGAAEDTTGLLLSRLFSSVWAEIRAIKAKQRKCLNRKFQTEERYCIKHLLF